MISSHQGDDPFTGADEAGGRLPPEGGSRVLSKGIRWTQVLRLLPILRSKT
jgi:hypothetical protein